MSRKEEREKTAGPTKYLVGDRVVFRSGETATIADDRDGVELSNGRTIPYLDFFGLELTGELRIEAVDLALVY